MPGAGLLVGVAGGDDDALEQGRQAGGVDDPDVLGLDVFKAETRLNWVMSIESEIELAQGNIVKNRRRKQIVQVVVAGGARPRDVGGGDGQRVIEKGTMPAGVAPSPKLWWPSGFVRASAGRQQRDIMRCRGCSRGGWRRRCGRSRRGSSMVPGGRPRKARPVRSSSNSAGGWGLAARRRSRV